MLSPRACFVSPRLGTWRLRPAPSLNLNGLFLSSPMKKSLYFPFIVGALLAAMVLVPVGSQAQVQGPCDDCHTMHNSQEGLAVSIDGPQVSLLVESCLGCHTGTNTGSNTIPYVYSTAEPTFGTGTLAGGNFYWVKEGNANAADEKGHNIFLNEDDDHLKLAPGSAILSCGREPCHLNLSQPFVDGGAIELEGKYGCEGCHLNPAHHADDTGPVIDSADQGWYRFLSGHDVGEGSGVAGIEDDDWQFTKGPGDHNEYLGYEGEKDDYGSFSIIGANTMTAFCSGCHGAFHIQQAGGWVRHPSDTVIPNAGEYASAFGAAGGAGGIFNPDIPVARQSLTAVSSEVTLGTGGDMVMCLSCHVPHGSPYFDLLRWEYSDMMAGGGDNTTGCFACHTTKDDAS